MAFWGVEVRPGKPYTHSFDPGRGRLRLCQATLGIGVAIKKSLVQCNVGRKSPVFLCALLPDKTESCHLDLEFEESEEVIFSVIGPRSVHLTGYYSANGCKGVCNDNSESYGEDIANSDSHESANSSGDKYDDSFIDDNDPEVSPFPDPDDEGTKNEKKVKRRLKKKYQIIESDEDVSSKQEKLDTECQRENSATEIEDENEDNDAISTLLQLKMCRNGKKAETKKNSTNGILLKEKDENVTPTTEINGLHPTLGKDDHTVTGVDGESDRKKKSSKKRKRQLDIEEERTNNGDNKDDEALQLELPDQKSIDDKPLEIIANPNSEDKKTKKKKRKSETKENNVEDNLFNPSIISSGLIIEVLQEGKNDGKIVATGKKVKVFLTAKLRDTGTIFYSNIDKSPHRFVIGAPDVVDGLNIGMDGMRVGEKRRLTVPPSMGYGSLGDGENIPPNSWLVYDVELLGVR
ncbi:peptidyl-prolyl cis-trans isomerase FKBP43-like isoform X2 [Impatiens glandulifera]|uniref:peptidyl-prolyl cis-trans isomerase FKBP43-like isoform X2 n=1 Tax=Impatiens glandulifera TaxID=253017 RepID=UPI001FB058F0|nr:peptidyl-prolyl cis-trans isomerase FKBP43-like isoform X2 [Impatiens glandulifera]